MIQQIRSHRTEQHNPNNRLIGRNRAVDRERLDGIEPPISVGYPMKFFSAFITLFKPENLRLLSPTDLLLKNSIFQISNNQTFPHLRELIHVLP
jgi:hypothetical protein